MLSGIVVAGALRAYREAQPYIRAWLEIRAVTVSGATQLSRQEVLSRLALPPGATQLSIDTERLASKLRTHPWVKEARVVRRIPHSLEVQLVERRAAALLQHGSGSLVLDQDGYVLSISLVARSQDEPDLPVLVGIEPNPLIQGEAAARAVAKAAVQVAGLVDSVFPRSVQSAAEEQGRRGRLQVDVTNPDNVVAHVNGLRFQFGSSGFEEKWDRYRKVESDLQVITASVGDGPSDAQREIHLQGHEIDLRYQDKVIVRERG